MWLAGSRAQAQLWHTGLAALWDLPGPGLKPVSPALAGGFLTTAPPGKFLRLFLFNMNGPEIEMNAVLV